ncbi:hypothetical protein HK102_002280 [Quaeritorhiza haematococci]|nr:hypothetical protein HK102_002280 [Quaeritorhiza haematococci]
MPALYQLGQLLALTSNSSSTTPANTTTMLTLDDQAELTAAMTSSQANALMNLLFLIYFLIKTSKSSSTYDTKSFAAKRALGVLFLHAINKAVFLGYLVISRPNATEYYTVYNSTGRIASINYSSTFSIAACAVVGYATAVVKAWRFPESKPARFVLFAHLLLFGLDIATVYFIGGDILASSVFVALATLVILFFVWTGYNLYDHRLAMRQALGFGIFLFVAGVACVVAIRGNADYIVEGFQQKVVAITVSIKGVLLLIPEILITVCDSN